MGMSGINSSARMERFKAFDAELKTVLKEPSSHIKYDKLQKLHHAAIRDGFYQQFSIQRAMDRLLPTLVSLLNREEI